MIIRNNNQNKVSLPKASEKSEKPPEQKDVFSFKFIMNETAEVLEKYKNLRVERTRGTDEPWWIEVSDAFQTQGDIVKCLGITGKGLMASTIFSGIGAVGIGAIGVKEIKEGIKDKDLLKTFGGSAAIMASISGGADFISGGLKYHGIGGATGVAAGNIMGKVSSGFGVAYGTAAVALGGIELVKGVKEKNRDKIVNGSLETGIGAAFAASSLGIGGTGTAIALGTLYGSKLIYNYREEIGQTAKNIAKKFKQAIS